MLSNHAAIEHITQDPSNDVNPEYIAQKPTEIKAELEMFSTELGEFFKQSGFPEDLNYFISRRAMVDMIVRTDKRKAYYRYFHKMRINECKVAALYAYWIIKYRPITLLDERFESKGPAICINEAFAIFVIYATLKRVHGYQQTYTGPNSYYDKLMYSFRFRNLSIDAMILLVESISGDTMNLAYDGVA